MESNLPMSFRAKVIKGAGRGKDLRVPTINVEPSAAPSELSHGIYAGNVRFPDGHAYIASFHYGPSPVFERDVSLEAHLLDVAIDEAPPTLDIELRARLRDVLDFPSVADLLTQIARDIEQTRAIMSAR